MLYYGLLSCTLYFVYRYQISRLHSCMYFSYDIQWDFFLLMKIRNNLDSVTRNLKGKSQINMHRMPKDIVCSIKIACARILRNPAVSKAGEIECKVKFLWTVYFSSGNIICQLTDICPTDFSRCLYALHIVSSFFGK